MPTKLLRTPATPVVQHPPRKGPLPPPVDLPAVDAGAVRAIVDYMLSHYDMRRPPEASAKLLALICTLHDEGKPFPQRQYAATVAGCSVFGVDAALSVALSREDIAMRMETRSGNVVQRGSVIRERFYDPNPELYAVYRAAIAERDRYQTMKHAS